MTRLRPGSWHPTLGHRSTGGSSPFMRGLAYLLYYGVATRLPRSYAIGGSLGLRMRRMCANRLFDATGAEVNVEQGAVFGSGKGVHLGSYSGIGIDAEIHGPVTIGNDVMMGPRCTIISRDHSFTDVTKPMRKQGFGEFRPVVIEDDVWVGANVTITAGVRVGRGSILAAGAVVTHDTPPYSIVAGVPARVIGSRIPST